MIIIMKPGAMSDDIDHIVEKLTDLGLRPEVSRGIKRTLIGVIGEEDVIRNAPLRAFPGVEEVVPILKPYKLAGREFQPDDSVVDVGCGVSVGGGSLGMIAGPCAVEGEDVLLEIARGVKSAGANILRGGAFKPRTSPYSYQGMGEEGLKILRAVGDELQMPVITEVMDPRRVEMVERYTDIIQIGARNMQNFNLLSEVGQTDCPVMLKRGMSATVKDLLMSAEYILAEGNKRVILCERGVKSFDSSTRNLLDLAMVPNVKLECHLPVIVDPSHATGRPELIPPMALAAIAAGADGVHVEVHCRPEEAMSDGQQALLPGQYIELMSHIRQLAELLGRKISRPEGSKQ